MAGIDSWIDTGMDFLDDWGGALLSSGITYATYVRESDAYDEQGRLSADAIIAQAGEIDASTEESIRLYTDQYNQYREDVAPWLEEGEKALEDLQAKVEAGPGDFEKPEYYDFGLKEGQKAIERKQSAKGMLRSGQTLKGLHEYGQEYADTEYGKFLDRYNQSLKPLQSLAGIGQTESANAGTAGSGYASTLSGLTNRASEIINSGYSSLNRLNTNNDINQDIRTSTAYNDIGSDLAYTYGAT